MEPLVVAGAVAGSAALAGLAIYAAWRATRPAKAETVKMEIVADEHVTYIRPAPSPPSSPPPAPSSARPAPRAAPPPLPPAGVPRPHAERAPAMLLTHGVTMQDDAFSRRAPPPRHTAEPRPPRAPPAMKSWAQQVRETVQPAVETEVARRQIGPVEPGRVAGACGGCGTRLSVRDARPLRIACPVCGRTKLIA